MHSMPGTQTGSQSAWPRACAWHLQCSFYEHRQYKIVYRRYASLFFMVGIDDDEVCSAQGSRAANPLATMQVSQPLAASC